MVDHNLCSLPTIEQVRAILDYDPETGLFTWKARPEARKSWNTRHPGMVAGANQSFGYVQIRINGRLTTAQRLAWFVTHGVWPPDDLDHINGKRDDNRIANLRPATRTQNTWNAVMRKDSTNGQKGIHKAHRGSGWIARIQVDGERRYLGTFPTIEAARAVYIAAAEEFHGEFACLGERKGGGVVVNTECSPADGVAQPGASGGPDRPNDSG
jgi:HNH endonuclease